MAALRGMPYETRLVIAGRTPACPCGDHSDDQEHRPGDDARQATSGVPPVPVGEVAREERRKDFAGST